MQFTQIILSFITQIINILALATGLSFAQAKLLLLLFLCYLVFVLLCTRIYVYFFRKRNVFKRTIVFEYNRLWYQIAQQKHTKNMLGEDFFFLQKEFLAHKGSDVYFQGKSLLTEYIPSLEKKLGISLLSQQQAALFSTLYNRYKIYGILKGILLIILTILTLGIIRLFVR